MHSTGSKTKLLKISSPPPQSNHQVGPCELALCDLVSAALWPILTCDRTLPQQGPQWRCTNWSEAQPPPEIVPKGLAKCWDKEDLSHLLWVSFHAGRTAHERCHLELTAARGEAGTGKSLKSHQRALNPSVKLYPTLTILPSLEPSLAPHCSGKKPKALSWSPPPTPAHCALCCCYGPRF